MIQFEQVSTSLINLDQVQTNLIHFNQVWTSLIQFEHVEKNRTLSFMDGPLQNHEFVAHYLLHVTIFSFVSYLELWIVHILYVSWSVECIWYRSYLWERHWRNDIVNLFPYTLYRLGLANYGQNWQILYKKILDIFACCLKMFKNPTIFNILRWVAKLLINQASDVPSMSN